MTKEDLVCPVCKGELSEVCDGIVYCEVCKQAYDLEEGEE